MRFCAGSRAKSMIRTPRPSTTIRALALLLLDSVAPWAYGSPRYAPFEMEAFARRSR